MIGKPMSETCQNQAMARLLIVEDNRDLVRSLFDYLEPCGYVMDTAPDGRTGLSLARDGHYDLLVLDWNLPRMDGLSVLQALRESGSAIPVLLLTARDDVDDKVTVFRAGAQDYLTKPFALPELEVRIESLLSRVSGNANQPLKVADLEYDTQQQRISRSGQLLHVYPACRKMLEVLMRASPAAVSRDELERAVWGEDPPDADRLRSHMYDLRKAIDANYEIKLLHTLPRIGYRLGVD